MIRLIQEYRATLRMVEKAKRDAKYIILAVVVSEGEYKGRNFLQGGRKLKCPHCGQEESYLNIYEMDGKTIQICDSCLEAAIKETVNERLDKSAAEDDITKLSSASSDLRYSIQYMETGAIPGTRRGTHRLSSEQREIPFDPYQFQINIHLIKMVALSRREQKELSEEKLKLLNDFLGLLTEKQKEAFVLVRGRRYTYEQAGRMLKIGTSTVKKYVYGAEKKLFLAAGKTREYVQMPSNSEGVFPQPVLKKTKTKDFFSKSDTLAR